MSALYSRLDAIDRAIVEATQAGLPIARAPYAAVARRVGVAERDVIARLEAMIESGAVRRIGAAVDHYRLGLVANGMTVWDVADGAVDELGAQVGALDFVTHCYRRPRRLPRWRYNLYAMAHGRTRADVLDRRDRIAALLGDACRASDILFSSEILKKTGLRVARRDGGGA